MRCVGVLPRRPIALYLRDSLEGWHCLRCGTASLAVVALAALFWAWTADPFRRVEFRLRAAGGVQARWIAVLPKPQAKFPVDIYLRGSEGSVTEGGRELRRFAELGVAAVGLESDASDQTALGEQMIALSRYLVPDGQRGMIASALG